MMTSLDILADVGLLSYRRQRRCITVRLIPREGKADLNESKTMQLLINAKER